MDQFARFINPNDSIIARERLKKRKENIKFSFKTRAYEVLSYLARYAFISFLKAVGKFGPNTYPEAHTN